MQNFITGGIKKLLSNKSLLIFPLLFLVIGFTVLLSLQDKQIPVKPRDVTPQPTKNSDVLGRGYAPPQIYIYGGDQKFSSGGMISLASTDEPAVTIGGYNISGSAEIEVYETNDDALLDYLAHDKDGKQTRKTPDSSKIQYITTVKKDVNTGENSGSKVLLPLKEVGIWYLKIKLGQVSSDAFVIRSNIGTLLKEGDNEFIFWGQDLKSKKSVNQGIVILYNLLDTRKELERVPFDSEGIAKAKLTGDADVALIAQNDERTIVPINLKYLNTGYNYSSYQPKERNARYFIFTDRPLYKPGDIVYFKAVLRDDDDARYSIPSGDALVKIYTDYEGKDTVLEKNYSVSSDGTISGQYQLPESSKTGLFNLSVSLPNQSTGNRWDYEYSSNVIYFDVEYFRKPEFSIEVTVPEAELIASDKTYFKISGQYFSGQPLINQKVKYTVYAADFYEYSYLEDQQRYSEQQLSSDYHYKYRYGNNKVIEGSANLDKNGEAKIDLNTLTSFNNGKTQVFSIETTIDDGSIDPSFSRKNILVYAGEYGIYRKDYSYGIKVNTPLSLPVVLLPYRNSTNVGNISLSAKIHRKNWISYQEANKKDPSYREEDEDLPKISAKTDSQGNAIFNFTPTEIGSYTITVEGKDARGNLISKIFYSYVSEEGQPYYSEVGNNNLTISVDKQKYQPDDTVKLNIYSYISDRDVFLSFERARVNRYQIIHLNGKNASVDVPIVPTDIPNIYASISSFSDYYLDENQKNIVVSPESKKLVVNITPNSRIFGPQDTITVNIQTTDITGNPISSEIALWAVDKAIFELSDNKLGDIFDTFWHERRNLTESSHSLEGIIVYNAEMGGGCFAKGTKVLMEDGQLKNIEDIKAGEYVLTRNDKDPELVKARVEKIHSSKEDGYLILNGNLKLTANHIIRVNNSWMEAGNIQIGDELTDSSGEKIRVSSIEWQQGKFEVYNLQIEKYHTYFADGFWVHNDKGVDRQTFKDTAYWNPSIHTDSSGHAQVSFKLPDNLTTWTIAALGSTFDTKVGQTTSEILVTKDVVVRPILPNILRVGDEINLSALVQNFTDSDQTFDIDLKFDSGDIESALYQDVVIKSNEMHQVYWKVWPKTENDKAKLIFSARSQSDKKLADAVTQEIPVREFGFEEKRAENGEGAKTFLIKLSDDSHKEKSKVGLTISPTIVGVLPTAMKYLIDYPYGCVEQTTSRFVPALIAKVNQDIFANSLEDKNIEINDVIKKGLSRLSTLQRSDGGWTWWYSGGSDPFITSYVVEYVLLAKQAGFEVDDKLLKGAQKFLESEKLYDFSIQQEREFSKEEIISKNYALTLLGEKEKVKKVSDLDNLSADLLSIVVMTNYLNGDKNPLTNGLDKLQKMAKVQGDGVFWEAGQKIHFASNDASTGFAIRAISLAGGDRDLAVKGARYLIRSRQSNYWSNTFATSQVIRALVDLSRTGQELTPNYEYKVSLDGKQIAQGTVTYPQQIIKEINIPLDSIKPDSSNLSISKKGDGQIYSSLTIDEFHTDRNAKSLNHGLSVKKEYVNEKGEQYTLAVGDSVTVKITVGGLKANENYGVISDELPSGLVPINERFKNEQYGYDPKTYYSSFDVTDKDVTENGMVLSLYQVASGERTYTYRARVVSEGTFIVPPATASLMYAPEVYGRSDVETIKITEESQIIPGKLPKQVAKFAPDEIMIVIISLLIILIIVGLIIMKKRGITLNSIIDKIKEIFKRNSKPPSNPPI